MSHGGIKTAGLATLLAVASAAFAQDPLGRPNDGIQAGLDAFRLAEEKRHANVAGQVSLNQQLYFWPGFSYGAPLIESPFGFPLSTHGYIARQPIGQQQSQTGPNRWESHPVYEAPLTPYVPLPPVDSHWLDGTAYAPLRLIAPSTAPPSQTAGRTLLDAVEQPRLNPTRNEPIPPPPPKPDPPRRGPREY